MYTFNREFGKAYIVDEDGLRHIHEVISKKISGFDTVVELDNNIIISTEDFDTALKDPMIRSSRIKRVRISHYKSLDEHIKKLTISFKNRTALRPIEVSIEGTRDDVISMSNDISNILEGMRAWYWPVSYKFDNIVDAFTFPLATFALAFVMQSTLSPENAFAKAGFLAILPVALIAVLFLFALRYLLFPSVIFNIGRSAEIHKIRKFVTQILLVTVLLGAILSIANRYIGNMVFSAQPSQNQTVSPLPPNPDKK